MNNVNPMVASVVAKAARFKVSDLVRETGLSRSYIHGFRKSEHLNPNVDNLQKISDAVTRLEAKAAKTKPRKNAAKKQTESRDGGAGSVAGGRK